MNLKGVEVSNIFGGVFNGWIVIDGFANSSGRGCDSVPGGDRQLPSLSKARMSSSTSLQYGPLYPTRSTIPPFRAIESAWCCIRGLRPMSPSTSTTTRGLPSFAGTWREGRHSKMTVVNEREMASSVVAQGCSARITSMWLFWMAELLGVKSESALEESTESAETHD
jgi:hypothetical protein